MEPTSSQPGGVFMRGTDMLSVFENVGVFGNDSCEVLPPRSPINHLPLYLYPHPFFLLLPPQCQFQVMKTDVSELLE